MGKTRFLRDNILDDMLDEIRAISDQVARQEIPPLLFYKSFTALTEMYETNKNILRHLEEAIETLRKKGVDNESIDPIVQAAVHIQMGIVNVHNTLKQDIENLLDSIQSLKKNLKIN